MKGYQKIKSIRYQNLDLNVIPGHFLTAKWAPPYKKSKNFQSKILYVMENFYKI